MQGKVKITAVLQNPDGVWENEFKFEYADNTEPPREQIATTAVAQFANNGMVRKIDNYTYEIIPWIRVKHVNVEFSAIDSVSGVVGASFNVPQPPPDRVRTR